MRKLSRSVRVGRFVAAASLTITTASVTSCQRNARPAPTAAPAGEPEANTKPASVDGARMFAVLEQLSSDSLGGRYTLFQPDIGRAADLLSRAYADAGLEPVDSDFRVHFPVATDVELGAEPKLSLQIGGRGTETKAGAFAPTPTSGSGHAEGEIVFVGYAARSAHGENESDDNRAYDDLAGVDLEGKVAVALLDAPSTPDPRTLFSSLWRGARQLQKDAAPLRKAKNTAALKRLHSAFKRDLVKRLAPFLRGAKLGPEFLAAPTDPLTDRVDVRGMAAAVREALRTRPGPSFPRDENRTSSKVRRLQEAGAAAVILVRGRHSFVTDSARKEDGLPDVTRSRPARWVAEVPVVQVRWHDAERLLKRARLNLAREQARLDRDLRPRSRRLKAATASIDVEIVRKSEKVPNVVAVMPGSDLPRQLVILGAHYDHIGTDADGRGHCGAIELPEGGRDTICNGADDNASGSAMVLEVARVLAGAGYKPRRTLVFAHFAGEEIGLFGSQALATKPPNVAPFASGDVVAMINLDMVGRLREEGLAIGGVGSSSGWMPLIGKIDTGDLPIVFDRAITTRSDHASFYRKGIPVLFFFTGVHDDYHRPGDEADKINRKGMENIAKLVLQLTRHAGDGHPLPFTPPANPAEGLVGALPGENPKTIEKTVGMGAE